MFDWSWNINKYMACVLCYAKMHIAYKSRNPLTIIWVVRSNEEQILHLLIIFIKFAIFILVWIFLYFSTFSIHHCFINYTFISTKRLLIYKANLNARKLVPKNTASFIWIQFTITALQSRGHIPCLMLHFYCRCVTKYTFKASRNRNFTLQDLIYLFYDVF